MSDRFGIGFARLNVFAGSLAGLCSFSSVSIAFAQEPPSDVEPVNSTASDEQQVEPVEETPPTAADSSAGPAASPVDDPPAVTSADSAVVVAGASAKPAPTSNGGAGEPTSDDGTTGEGSNSRRKLQLRHSLAFVGGYAVPSGAIMEGADMVDMVTAAIPLGVDYRVLSPGGFALGLYLQVAPGIAGKDLRECDDCSTYGGRVGLELGRHFAQTSALDPWITFGVGYEFLSTTSTFEGPALTSSGSLTTVQITRTDTASTFPELIAQVGVDIGGDDFRFGPYAFASWGAYDKLKVELRCSEFNCSDEAVADSANISDDRTSSHFWLGGGLRVSLNR